MSSSRPKRSRKQTGSSDELRYFNGELVQEGDKVSIHFRNGEKASEGKVSGRSEEDGSLVQVIIDAEQEEFRAEDGEDYAPGSALVIHGSFLMPLGAEMPQKKSKKNAPAIPTRTIRRLGVELPVVGFPGIALCHDKFSDPKEASKVVASAVKRGATYFDVAPEYGDGLAQARLGPALAPHRKKCFVACKTMFRDAAGARRELEESLIAMQTTYFDLYQLHSMTSEEDVDTAMGQGGAIEVLRDAKKEGKVKAIGFSAHDEEQALRLIATGEVHVHTFALIFREPPPSFSS
jgi:hypothetical protein